MKIVGQIKSLLVLLLIGFVTLPIKAQEAKVAPCRVALVQSHLMWGDVKANLSAFKERIKQCKGCDLIVFPELFTSGCEMKKKDKEEAMRDKDSVASYYSAIIKEMQQWSKQSQAVVVGSTIYKENGMYYNRLLAVFPNGKYHYYDKHNCFKKGAFSPGDKQLVFSWKGHRFATYICYDLRFAEWSKNDSQYDTSIYIANWPESRSTDWNELLRQRAVENKAYVIAVNCAGTDPTGISYIGNSCLLSPNGEVHAKCEDYKEDIVIVEY